MASKSTTVVLGFTKLDKPTSMAVPSGIVLTDTAGNQWYLWVETDGTILTDEAAHAEAAGYDWTSGHVVGGQS